MSDQGPRQAAQKAAPRGLDQGGQHGGEGASAHQDVECAAVGLEDLAERYVEVVGAETDEGARLARGCCAAAGVSRAYPQALIELGSEADLNLVLERVYAAMKDELNSHDLDTYADGKTVRWRNSAQWMRATSCARRG